MVSTNMFLTNNLHKAPSNLTKNLWALFVGLLITGFFALLIVINFIWKDILDDNAEHQKSVVNLLASSTKATLNAQQNLLDLVGFDLLKGGSLHDLHSSSSLLSRLLENNPALLAFGLAAPDGQLILTSDNLHRPNLPNLAKYPASADSFAETLNQNQMVLGRTYLMPTLQEWVIPIRKALRNENNEVVAVMTAGLRVNGRDAFLEGNGLNNGSDTYFLIREADKYIQYASPSLFNINREFYSSPVLEATYDRVFDTLADKKISKTALYGGETSKTVEFTNRYDQKNIVTLQYIPEYKLWAAVTINKSALISSLLNSLWVLLGCFLVVFTVIFLLFRRIIDTEQQHIQELEFQSQHQELTKLPNRDGLKKVMSEEAFCDGNQLVAAIYIDIDNFKSANDTYGGDFGDQILLHVASRLNMHKAAGDRLFHTNGDEFVMKKSFVDPERLEQFVTNLLGILSQPYSHNDANIILTSSIGVACYPENGESFDEILKAAEIAMFEAKKQKNRFVFFGDNIYEKHYENLQIEQQLKHSIGSEQFFMTYQPQVSSNGDVIGIEALARWNNDVVGAVPPDKFIRIAESSGLMPRLGRYILTSTFADLKEIDRGLTRELSASINISASQFLQRDFYTVFEVLYKTSALQQVRICLELTESVFIEDLDTILPIIKKFHDLGVTVSLDDFGTGFSSLNMLRKLPIDELKIDKSFVDSLLDDMTARNMVKNIITISETLALSVIAEGVETQQHVDILKSLNCHRFQGYYFSKPLALDALTKWLKQKDLHH